MQQLVNTRDQLRSGLSIFGLILVLASATSFNRALQRVYERAWQLSPGGARGSVRGLVWLVGLIVYFLMIAVAFQLTTSKAVAVSAVRVIVWWPRCSCGG